MNKMKRVIIIAAVGAVLAVGAAVASIGFASSLDTSNAALVLGYETDTLPVERLAERDAVDSGFRQYGLISTGGNALIHYSAHFNSDSGKCEYSTDENGEPRIAGDYLDTGDAEIVFEDGSRASKGALKPGTPVLVESDYTTESSPSRIHCTKVTILK